MDTFAEVEVVQPGENNVGQGSLLDFLEGYIGLVSDDANSPAESRLSDDCGLEFTEGLLEKRRQGKW